MEETKINEILQAWRKYYKGRCGIAGEFSDAEVLEQLAIEQFKGTLNEWINASCGFITTNTAIVGNTVLPAVFSSEEMIAFGNFIRDNYYVAGSPKMLSYHPEKYPHSKVEDIFVYWCLENGS